MEATSTLDISSEDRRKSNKHFSLNFDCSQENLDDIPHPDDSFSKQKSINMLLYNDELELPPLPPKIINNKLQTITDCSLKNTSNPSLCNSDDLISFANIPLPQEFSFHFTPTLPRSDNHEVFPEIKDQISQDCEGPDSSARYSPSKIDSDEENQYFMTVKPKVLGKEQAKKRLMAFSLSKQHPTLIKKQSKIAPSPKNIKEKPPNPNKSSGVQDQFRATISEIEEEKKKMWQNMPNYLLSEMNDLVKSTHPILTPLKLLEKQKSETVDSETKDKKTENLNKYTEESVGQQDLSIKDVRKSKSSSKSHRNTRSRSIDRTHSRKSRDSSKRRRSSSKSKSKNSSKTPQHKISRHDMKDTNYILKPKTSYENWKSFKDSGFVGVSDIWSSLLLEKESYEDKEREHRRSLLVNDDKWYYKPVFSFLKKESKLMKSFQAKPVNSRTDNLPLYLEKKIKFTKTKPVLIWSENPSFGNDFYMSRSMLLDNCDLSVADTVSAIINNKKNFDSGNLVSTNTSNTRNWYPCQFAISQAPQLYDDFEVEIPQSYEKLMNKMDEISLTSYLDNESQKRNPETKIGDEVEKELGKKNNKLKKHENWDKTPNIRERKVSLVSDGYLSDEEGSSNKIKEMVVGDVKVQMNLDRNCIKVRSRWDSDYENEISEKDDYHKEDDMDLATPEPEVDATLEKNFISSSFSNENSKLMPQIIKEESDVNKNEPQLQTYNDKAGNLASEYEEFLKMVSFECNLDQSIDNKEKTSETDLKSEKQKSINVEGSIADVDTQKSKFEITEWDKDSDHEEKPHVDKMNYRKSESEKDLLPLKEEKVKLKPKKIKKHTLAKKKNEKLKSKKEKLSRKALKGKKKKQVSSSSSDSSSDSNDTESDSDSDSDESTSPRRRRKKIKKNKKKYKKISSSETESESESDSDSNTDSDSTYRTSKKKKSRKKGVKRKKESESSESDNGNKLLKQLDFKKQLIMKKIEEIDFISERCGKNKAKEAKHKNSKKEKNRSGDVDSLKKYMKSLKKKCSSKDEKPRKIAKFSLKSIKGSKEISEDSDSDSSEEDDTPKLDKGKEKEESESSVSESSDSDSDEGPEMGNNLMGIKSLKMLVRASEKKKSRKNKRKEYDSSECESGQSFKGKSKSKKDVAKSKVEGERAVWKDDFLIYDDGRNDCTRLKYSEERLDWKEKKKKTKSKVKKVKGTDDWEASSSSDESVPEVKGRESWDDDVLSKDGKSVKMKTSKETSIENVDVTEPDRNFIEKNAIKLKPDEGDLPSANNSKIPATIFPFKEKSFSGFGQELSGDFFLNQCSNSNSRAGIGSDDSRPFCSITKAVDQSKHGKSELYSPGHSDSEMSDIAEAEYKMEKINNSNCSAVKSEVYDPLNSESDTSLENDNAKLNNIPLPRVSDVTNLKGNDMSVDKVLHASKESPQVTKVDFDVDVAAQNSCKFKFKPTSFSPSEMPLFASNDFVSERGSSLIKKQVINVKSQPKLKSKAASVFQDDSDDSTFEAAEKTKEPVSDSNEHLERMGVEGIARKSKPGDGERKKHSSKSKEEEKEFGGFDNYKEKSEVKERKSKKSSSRERRSCSRSKSTRYRSPTSRKRSSTPEILRKTMSKENKREIRSDSFEIEPLKSATQYKDLEESVQPIPVLTGLGKSSSEQPLWSRSQFSGYPSMELHSATNELIDPSESFDIYPSEESAYENRHFEKVFIPEDKTSGSKKISRERKDKRWSRSKSSSPRKKRRSKSPEKRRSPRNRSPKKSKSPKRRNKSPHSPRRKSPKKKSPSNRYKSSRSPDRKRKSRSRSPRKRRSSPGKRSYSISPHKNHRRESPSRRRISPSVEYSPCKSVSPRRDEQFSNHYSNSFHNRIPVIGARNESSNHEFSPSHMGISPMGFSESNLGDPGMSNSFYGRDYSGEFGTVNYQEEIGHGNLITVKNHDLDKRYSPERLSLDQRIEMELGVPMQSRSQNDQYHKQPFQDVNMVHFQNSYENHSGSENFYQNSQNVPPNTDFNSQYYNGHHPSQTGYGSFQQYPNSQGSMLQVGNIVEVVPTQQQQHQLPPPAVTSGKNSCHQIMQVGNVLQVLPSQKSQGSPMPFHNAQNYGPSSGSSMAYPIKTQKATAVVAPSSIIPQPNPDSLINPLIKAIQLEREKRRKEKEKRKAERESRRKARQLRREAKLMSVNEKLKKSVQDEGLMLGQEVEDDELLDGMDLPSPPIPVEIITVTSPSALPPAGKGILITAGFMQKPPSEKKEVKFADGVLPGEGTSTSDGEDMTSPPPKPKLPKEKRYKKKKMKVKKKVKVEIIKQVIQDDDPDDDLSPPPPPPGDPPPIYFARYSFAGNAQFPVIQTQTTTSTITTVQCSAPTF